MGSDSMGGNFYRVCFGSTYNKTNGSDLIEKPIESDPVQLNKESRCKTNGVRLD